MPNEKIGFLPVNRRRAVLGTAATLTLPFLARRAYAARELRIFTWEGYAEPEWVERFEKTTGARAKISYTGSADEMYAKMQASKGDDFDVLAFDTSMFHRYLEDRLLQPIDLKLVPNASNLLPEFQRVPTTLRNGQQFGVPWAWGSLPLIYDKSAFPQAPESWEVMWDPQYAQQIIAVDDATVEISTAAIALGLKNPYKLTDADFDRVKSKLIEQKKLLLTYYSGFDSGVSIFASSGVKLMLSQGEPQLAALIKKGVNAGLAIPKEGAMGWLDCWAISQGARNRELAHAWIDTCLDKSVGTAMTRKIGFANATDLDANVSSGFTYGDRLIWMEAPEDWNRRVNVWNEIKASL